MLNNCPDCDAVPGEEHGDNCDVERCAGCGNQRLGCDCGDLAGLPRLRWTGLWPGAAECREYGLFVRLVPGRGWVSCDRSDSGASEDLNRLVIEGRWSQKKGRFVITNRRSRS